MLQQFTLLRVTLLTAINLLLQVYLRNIDMHEAATTFVCLCREIGAGYVPYWKMIQTHILRLNLYILYISSLLLLLFQAKQTAVLGQSDCINMRIFTKMKMYIVFLIITLYNLVVLCQGFGGKCCLRFQ